MAGKELTLDQWETIVRDLTAITERIDRAKDGLDRHKAGQRAVWDELDLAEARLQGLSMFLGLLVDRAEV